MKGWTKRRVALVLALALLASQMSGCKKDGQTNQSNANVSNNNAVVTEETKEMTPKETEPAEDDGWLQENLENIRQSLLDGDYAEVVEILLGMQDQLADDPDFNALLYIAYMGNGNESEAEALLNNPNLDTDAFTDAFLENTEALKGNEDMADIERSLMEHMLGLGESNPDAYGAVARIGANIQSASPNDPTVYAARYIAALAAGDEAAAKAILAEAEANGVTEEALMTTAIELDEKYNLNTITVEETAKATTTSVTRTESGDVVKVVETVTNTDGTKTETVKDVNGTLYGEAKFDANGNPISRVFYVYQNKLDANGQIVKDEDGNPVMEYAGTEEYTYANGSVATVTSKLSDGSMNYVVTLDAEGKVLTAQDYSTGEAKDYPETFVAAMKFELNDKGDLESKTIPVYDATGAVVGSSKTIYSYAHPAGMVEDWAEYDAEGNPVREMDMTYEITKDGAKKTSIAESVYDSSPDDYCSNKVTTKLIYENGEVVKQVTDNFMLRTDGSYMQFFQSVLNYNEHTWLQIDPYGFYNTQAGRYEAVMDESNTYLLTQEVYNTAGTTLLEKRYVYYTGTEMTSELDVAYDANGNVTKESYYGHEGDIYYDYVTGNPIPATEIIYHRDEDGNITKVEKNENEPAYVFEYGGVQYFVQKATGKQETTYSADASGNRVENITSTTYTVENGEITANVDTYTYTYTTTVDEETGKETTTVTDSENNVVKTTETVTDEAGNKTVTVKDAESNVTSTTLIEYTYAEDGTTITAEKVYDVGADNTKVQTSEKTYTEDGGYTVTAYDTDGNTTETYYNSEGYAYEIAVYDTTGQLMMLMRLDPETGDVETTEGGSTEGGTTEVGNTEGGNTEGGNTEGDNTEDGNTEGGNTEGENTEGENTEGENTEGGNTEGGNTEGGNTEGGNTEGGNTEGDNTEDDNTEGDNTEGDNNEGDNTEDGNTEDGNTEGGNTKDGNTEGGNIEGGTTEGEATEGGNTESGNTEGGNTEGGSNEAPEEPEDHESAGE